MSDTTNEGGNESPQISALDSQADAALKAAPAKIYVGVVPGMTVTQTQTEQSSPPPVEIPALQTQSEAVQATPLEVHGLETSKMADPPPAMVEMPAIPMGRDAGTDSHSVGSTLRAGRERLGLDINQVAAILRIRHPFLTALEEGRVKDLPSSTYAIGFLRTYAEYLKLDGEEMVRRFRQEAAQALAVHSELQFPSPVSEGRLPSPSVLLTGLAIAVVAYGLWWGLVYKRDQAAELIPAVPERLVNMLKRPAVIGASEPSPSPSPSPSPDSPAPAEVKSETPPETDTAKVEELKPIEDVVPPAEEESSKPAVTAKVSAPTPTEASQTPPTKKSKQVADKTTTLPPPPVASEPEPLAPPTEESVESDHAVPSGHVVIKAATDDCWVQVRESDGQLVISRLLHQGETYQVPDRSGLTLTAGNAGSLQVYVDGKLAPSLGTSKQVKRDISLDPNKLLKRAGATP